MTNSKNSTSAEPNAFYFMAAILVRYVEGKVTKDRHMNIMLEMPQPMLMKRHLGSLHTSAVSRLHSEDNIPPSDIKEVCILNCFHLASTTPSVFNSTGDEMEHTEYAEPKRKMN